MKMPPTGEVENKPSKLLNCDENNMIFRLLGNRCQTLATTVIQLFLTEPPNHSHWIRRDTGVLCFVKDNIRKNYFFRLFCLRRNNMIWEHEMYNNLEYNESTSFFHVFEGQDYLVAFNFASTEEARDVKKVVDFKIYAKRKKEERRRQHSNRNSNSNSSTVHNSLRPTNPQDFAVRKVPDLAAKQAKRRRNITKADIGSPKDFKHVSHVGWNPDSGFDVDVVDDQLRKFFAKAGVSEKELQDKETREFIYGFINERGGFDAVTKENIEPCEPNKGINNISPAITLPVPPVPPRGPGKPHVRAAPPPPPSGPPGRPAAKLQDEKPSLPTQNNFSPPVAPPPPPLPSNVIQPVAQSDGMFENSKSAPVDMNSALLQSIREGTTLKPVEDRKVAAPVEARNDLLCEIRKGFSLKPVQEREVKQLNQPNDVGPIDFAKALARALAERSKAIHSEDDDDSEDDDSNDDEWDC